MKKIYLTGYYGQNNLGDDYLLYSIVDQLNSLKERIELVIEVGNDMFNGKLYDQIVENYPYITLRYCNIGGLAGKFKKIAALMKCDRWIIGGVGYSHLRTFLPYSIYIHI